MCPDPVPQKAFLFGVMIIRHPFHPLRAVTGFLHSLGDDRVASGLVCEGQLT